MEYLFWTSVFLILYPYVGYPLLLQLLSHMWGKSPQHEEGTAQVTLLISAYNEEAVIADKIENSLALDYPSERLEIVVASESDDRTNEIVGKYAARGVRLRAFSCRQGKAATLYATVPQAQGEIIVFSDANVFYDRDALRKLVRNFADPRIGCVSGRHEYVEYGAQSAGASETVYWRFETWVKQLESRIFSMVGANGSMFALRKKLYAPLSKTRGDDFELPVRVLLQGGGTVLEPEAIGREKGLESTRAEFRRRMRIVMWNFGSALKLAVEAVEHRSVFLLFQLVSHKFLRWLAPIFLVVLLVSSAMLEEGVYQIILGIQVVFYALALVGWVMDSYNVVLPKLFRLPYYFCAIHLAALVSLVKLLTSSSSATWERVR